MDFFKLGIEVEEFFLVGGIGVVGGWFRLCIRKFRYWDFRVEGLICLEVVVGWLLVVVKFSELDIWIFINENMKAR